MLSFLNYPQYDTSVRLLDSFCVTTNVPFNKHALGIKVGCVRTMGLETCSLEILML